MATTVASAPCHDDYAAGSFEESGDDLHEFVDEYFTSARIPFLPQKTDNTSLGLLHQADGTYRLPDALHYGGGHRLYPVRAGLWKIAKYDAGVRAYHLLVCEPYPLTQSQAFNTWNDLLGEPFADYDDGAYGMTLQPEDVRRKIADRFVTINVTIYGLQGDATELKRTCADVVFTDYTAWVERNGQCRQASHSAITAQGIRR
jgi:hypothetical protein